MNSLYCFLFFCFSNSLVKASDENYNLKSISVLFRHGDRTPQTYPIGFYPTDPYRNRTFSPMGYGGLTNEGKRREYQIGTSLRKQYGDFISETYESSELSVVSTNKERTKMSLLLVLAGLFPPKNKQVWKHGLDWQPIPINAIPTDVSSFLYPAMCPKYSKELKRVMESEEYKKDVSRFEELMKNLTIHVGREIDNVKIIYHLYHTLTAETAMHLTLPEWTKPYFPNGLIINATIFQYITESYTQELRKLNGGLFIRKILNDLKVDRINELTKRPKVNLYSVHENNLGAVLNTLNLFKDEIPLYSSAVIFELREKNTKQYVKMVYYKGMPAEFETKIIPGCTEYCPLDEFKNFLNDVIPDDIMDTCFGPTSNSELISESVNPIVWIYQKVRSWFNL